MSFFREATSSDLILSLMESVLYVKRQGRRWGKEMQQTPVTLLHQNI